MLTLLTAIKTLLAQLVSGSGSLAIAKGKELASMRELYIGTGGTLIGRLRNDSQDVDFGTVANATRLPYDFAFISSDSTASGFVAIS